MTLRALHRWLGGLACLAGTAVQAQPWPEPLLIGPGYGHCPDFYRALSLREARQPELLARLQRLPAGTYGLVDGKYLSGPQGGTLVTATADEAGSLPRNLCLAWSTIAQAGPGPSLPRPDAQGHLHYVGVQVSALERPLGKACARFSQRGQPVAAGCLDAALSSPQTDQLLLAFRLGSTLRLTLNSKQPRGRLSTGQAAYRIESISY
ncbi:toxin [Bordetella genomosp. 12]|uniref:Toxin n=1 Tax=Bordetella genomosp. 12 TaxID=463035 RepID=A0A261VJP9_9BORD|nr:toxin [Bordetella genomosp. 12]OZI73961.1 toxin [Bordetella genomosp. 12]